MGTINSNQGDKNEINQIIELIKSDLNDQLSADQEKRLREWLNQSDENRQLYEKIKNGRVISERLAFRDNIPMDKDWSKIDRAINPPKSIVVKLIPYVGYAAAVAVIIGIAAVFILTNNSKPVYYANDKPQANSENVMLTLSNGKKVSLGEQSEQDIFIDGGVHFKDSLGQLSYKTKGEKTDHLSQINTISIPRGREYKLMLEDGTEIYLNSETELKFPEYFDQHQRQIELTGEAYLKVTKDKNRPFIVKMNSMTVEVLGTEFNLMSYPDDNYSLATLVEGSIKVQSPKSEVIIKPGQQAFVDALDAVVVQNVNVNDVTAWMRGEFVFENERLEQVLNTMERWYDVDFKYASEEIKAYHFTGKLRRHDSIMESLEVIEKINVICFVKNEKVIEVKEIE